MMRVEIRDFKIRNYGFLKFFFPHFTEGVKTLRP